MSRIGTKPIDIPSNTEISQDEKGVVTVTGPKGELSRRVRSEVSVTIDTDNNQVTLAPNDKSSRTKALWGTFASHITNMIQGVNEPFEKRLTVEGVGYRAEIQGDQLMLMVGPTHPVYVPIPDDLTVSAEQGTISVSGIDKERVGALAAKIRGVRPPEPYKGKGIRYEDEEVRRKEGKSV